MLNILLFLKNSIISIWSKIDTWIIPLGNNNGISLFDLLVALAITYIVIKFIVKLLKKNMSKE